MFMTDLNTFNLIYFEYSQLRTMCQRSCTVQGEWSGIMRGKEEEGKAEKKTRKERG